MRSYPASCAETGFRLFRKWLGARFARAVTAETWSSDGPVGRGTLRVAREWMLDTTVVDTLAPDSGPAWETARAQLESSLDAAGLNLAVFVPRNAPLPAGEAGIAEFTRAALAAGSAPEGRLEITRTVPLQLRRMDAEGSVMTIVGALSPHWARFTNRVQGTYRLDSSLMFRLPAETARRDAIFEDIIAAADPTADSVIEVPAVDAWSAVDLEEGGSTLLGTPLAEDDAWSASLRRNVRKLLSAASKEQPVSPPAAAGALVLVGAATYADEERLSWVLRGMDPAAYGRYDIVAVIADGIVKALLEPPAGSLPWD